MTITEFCGLAAGRHALAALLMTAFTLAALALTGDARAQDATGDAQAAQERSCDTDAGHALDFWIGEWGLTWPGGQGGTPEGGTGNGTNTVSRVLGDCVIEEQFRMAGFDGMSVSVFNGRTKDWRQTWVDSQGGYIALSGGMHDGRMELRTEPFENPKGEKQINRMIWTNVTENALDWTWQRSLDGGEEWDDLWQIHYVRRGASAGSK